MQPNYDPIPTSALLALARLILKRTKLSLPNSTREQAIGIIRGVRPAPSKSIPLSTLIASAVHKPLRPDSVCRHCGKAVGFGEVCKTVWNTYDGEHINCKGETHAEV